MPTTTFDVAQRMLSPEMVARTHEYLSTRDTRPLHVDLDLTSECNYRCRHCGDLARGLLNRGGMAWPVLEPLIQDLEYLGAHEVVLIGGGEPTLSPHLPRVLRELHRRGIRSGVVTNGSRLTPQILDAMDTACDWVRVSLDAGTPETYARVHSPQDGATFDSVITNLECMIARMGKRVGVSFLITPSNTHEIARAAQLVKSIGAAYIRIRPMQHPISGTPLVMPSRCCLTRELEHARTMADVTFDVSVGEMTEARASVQQKSYHACHAQAFGLTIAGDGKVYVCSKWRGKDWACIGDVHAERLSAIWYGDRRRTVVRGLDPSSTCAHVYCHAHPLNALLASAISSEYPAPSI